MLNLIEAATFLSLLVSTLYLYWQLRRTRLNLQEQQQQSEQLNHLAYYDELTQIPNQTYFKKHLQHVIARTERSKNEFALFYIDLDNFKPFNDEYGHRMGDQVLKVAAEAVVQSLREGDFPARFSSDEFVAVLEGTSDRDLLERVAQRLIDNIYRATQGVDGDYEISASIGISLYPQQSESVNELIDIADHAMYSAKQRGKSGYVFA